MKNNQSTQDKKSTRGKGSKSSGFPKPIYTIQPIPESLKRMKEWKRRQKKKDK